MKKGFTIIELLIVVIIIWLLIWALKPMFTYKNVDRLKYDTCYLHINWKLDNFFQSAILQKSVYTWDKWRKVNTYWIKFDVTNQKIDLIYSWTQIWWNIIKSIDLNWTWFDKENDCFTPSYHTKLSWENIKVIIKPWLQVDNKADWDAWIVLYTWSSFSNKANNWATWAVSFYYCEWSWTQLKCYERNKIVIDTKVNLIKKYFCKKKRENPCASWSE